jgi:5-methylcytosine-specific restriction endonuclease McrA
LSEYYKDKKNRDGLYTRCKECHKQSTKRWGEKNRERRNKIAMDSYYRNHEKQLERMREYKRRNKEKMAADFQKYYKANPEYFRKKAQRYRAEHLEIVREKEAAYYQANREQIRARKRAYRARKYGAPSDLWERPEILKRDNYTCQYCGFQGDALYLHVDHYVPLGKGGTDLRDNVVTACIPCNQSKHDKLPDEWNPGMRAEYSVAAFLNAVEQGIPYQFVSPA